MGEPIIGNSNINNPIAGVDRQKKNTSISRDEKVHAYASNRLMHTLSDSHQTRIPVKSIALSKPSLQKASDLNIKNLKEKRPRIATEPKAPQPISSHNVTGKQPIVNPSQKKSIASLPSGKKTYSQASQVAVVNKKRFVEFEKSEAELRSKRPQIALSKNGKGYTLISVSSQEKSIAADLPSLSGKKTYSQASQIAVVNKKRFVEFEKSEAELRSKKPQIALSKNGKGYTLISASSHENTISFSQIDSQKDIQANKQDFPSNGIRNPVLKEEINKVLQNKEDADKDKITEEQISKVTTTLSSIGKGNQIILGSHGEIVVKKSFQLFNVLFGRWIGKSQKSREALKILAGQIRAAGIGAKTLDDYGTANRLAYNCSILMSNRWIQLALKNNSDLFTEFEAAMKKVWESHDNFKRFGYYFELMSIVI